MTRSLALNLPIRLECFRIPVEWKRDFNASDCYYTGTTMPEEAVETYDPWEKRLEFFKITRGDSDALFAFLKKIGLFDRAEIDDVEWNPSVIENGGFVGDARDQPMRDESYFWEMRDWIEGEMRGKTRPVCLEESFEFHSSFVIKDRRNAGLVVRTISFLEALAVSVLVDRVLAAKVRKCGRSDCSALFATTSNRKQKYCQWYCGHIEAVRAQRKAAKKFKKGRRS